MTTAPRQYREGDPLTTEQMAELPVGTIVRTSIYRYEHIPTNGPHAWRNCDVGGTYATDSFPDGETYFVRYPLGEAPALPVVEALAAVRRRVIDTVTRRAEREGREGQGDAALRLLGLLPIPDVGTNISQPMFLWFSGAIGYLPDRRTLVRAPDDLTRDMQAEVLWSPTGQQTATIDHRGVTLLSYPPAWVTPTYTTERELLAALWAMHDRMQALYDWCSSPSDALDDARLYRPSAALVVPEPDDELLPPVLGTVIDTAEHHLDALNTLPPGSVLFATGIEQPWIKSKDGWTNTFGGILIPAGPVEVTYIAPGVVS